MSILLQASYAGESKTMPFLIIREHTFYGLFSLWIDVERRADFLRV